MIASTVARLLRSTIELLRGSRSAPATRRQVAALPVRRDAKGELHVLLVTTRGSKRLIIPKGWPIKGHADHEAAAIEAREEAGVLGRVSPEPVGLYEYSKRVEGRAVRIAVTVYRLDVEQQLSRWREKGQRRLVWMPLVDALTRVGELGLVPIFKSLGG